MFRVARGIAVGAAMVAALTACGGADGGSPGATDGGDGAGAVTGGGGQPKVPVVLTEDQVRRALVDTDSAPQGWEGFGVSIPEHTESVKTCQDDTGTKCGGFTALGTSHIDQVASEGQVIFTIYAFRTPDDVKFAMKSLAAKERRKSGAGAKPLKVSAGADETDAFTGRNTEIFMRLGGSLIRVASEGLREGQPYADFARLQIDRIKQTAEGKNPDL